MRIFSYILAALVTIFILNVALSFSLPAYRNTLVDARTALLPASKKPIDSEADGKQAENARLVESLERIDKHIESLNEAKKTGTNTGMTLSGTSLSEEAIQTVPEIPLSWLFLAKIMPEVMPKKTENKGFFGIQVMGKILYNTYLDDKKNIKIYAFSDTYDTLLLNMKLTSNVFTLNETDQFFWFTFFLNPVKKDPKDTMIRFITALEGRAIGVEIPKNYYSTFKKMLLKNK